MKILIAVPCMDNVSARFAQSLATMRRVGDCQISFLIGSLIYESRNKLAKQAITSNADYVLWLDSDMVFPVDTMEKLIAHAESGKDIISGIYFHRVPPFKPVVYDYRGEYAEKEEYADEVFKCDAVGFGCVLTSKKVLFDVMLNYETWFSPLPAMGEDFSFCKRAKDLGYDIWVDPTIKCGHIGQLVIGEETYKAVKK